MSIQLLLRTGSCGFLIALLALVSWPALAAARDDPAKAVPPNAHAKRYGGGWQCDRGYRKVGLSCAVVQVPAHAYWTKADYSRGWKCARGYREHDIEIVVTALHLTRKKGDRSLDTADGRRSEERERWNKIRLHHIRRRR